MKDRSMQQYLAQVKILVDNIASAGSKIDNEDIILYILNGLPSSYNSFKTAIRTSLNPIDLDVLYSLLCSEEINLQNEQQKDHSSTSESMALHANRTSSSRGRSSTRFNKGRNSSSRWTSASQHSASTAPTSFDRPVCQICGKNGHSALNCWHRCNLKYAPTT
ncbi:Retrovirus-related Pol polyprotein from transposon TNT 1-94 [Dendrobium catenatum]|uniref:Retrovirus-related Pol polyprotein from transposon TNT 1-94 n=1 Tax=Dendrobium catenatum TaxID=906689 RepID=A0A2I0W8C8_9ASPA|nr:Retrovirus-related Pol polyprotein from transposon TNT 1-94 [Dendrobium catenatum]